jgi:hypothetical protein
VSQLVLKRDHVLVDTVGLGGVETPTQVPYHLSHKEGLCTCECTYTHSHKFYLPRNHLLHYCSLKSLKFFFFS